MKAEDYLTKGIHVFRAPIPIVLFIVALRHCIKSFPVLFTARLIFFLWAGRYSSRASQLAMLPCMDIFYPMFGDRFINHGTVDVLLPERTFVYISFLIFSFWLRFFRLSSFPGLITEGFRNHFIVYTQPYGRIYIYPLFFSIFSTLCWSMCFALTASFFPSKTARNHCESKSWAVRNTPETWTYEYRVETRVRERTMELMEQNNRLTDHAFFHAHVLCTGKPDQGLVNLMNPPIDPAEEKKSEPCLPRAWKELDDTIHEMNNRSQNNRQFTGWWNLISFSSSRDFSVGMLRIKFQYADNRLWFFLHPGNHKGFT